MNKFIPLHVPETHPRGVFEKYIDGKIEITEEAKSVCECKLDDKGRRRYAEYEAKGGNEAVVGIARLRWRSAGNRVECIELQTSKKKNREHKESRWTEILLMASAIKCNVTLPPPALVHPELHAHDGLLVIDGARRIIANIEASTANFVVVIIKRHLFT